MSKNVTADMTPTNNVINARPPLSNPNAEALPVKLLNVGSALPLLLPPPPPTRPYEGVACPSNGSVDVNPLMTIADPPATRLYVTPCTVIALNPGSNVCEAISSAATEPAVMGVAVSIPVPIDKTNGGVVDVVIWVGIGGNVRGEVLPLMTMAEAEGRREYVIPSTVMALDSG